MRLICAIFAFVALTACDGEPSGNTPPGDTPAERGTAELGGAILEGRRSIETLEQLASISPPAPGSVLGVKTDETSVLLHQHKMLSEWSIGASEATPIVIANSGSVHPVGDWTRDQLFLECRVRSRSSSAGCKTPGRYKTVRGPVIYSRKTRALVKVPVPEGVNQADISMARLLEKSFLVTDGRGLWEIDAYGKAVPLDGIRPEGAEFVASISPTGRFVAFAHVEGAGDSTARGQLRIDADPLDPDSADRSFVVVVDRNNGAELHRIKGAPSCKFTPDESRLICIHLGIKGRNATPVESIPLSGDGAEITRVEERYHHSLTGWAISADSTSFVVGTFKRADVFDATSLDPLHRIVVRSRASHGLLSRSKLISVVDKKPQIRRLGSPSVDLQVVAEKAAYDRSEQQWRDEGGDQELLRALAKHTKPRRKSKWVKRDLFEVDSRALTVIPRAGVTPEKVLEAFANADVEVVAALELVGIVTVQTDVIFDDVDSLLEAQKALEDSGLFETVATEGRMEDLWEGRTF